MSNKVENFETNKTKEFFCRVTKFLYVMSAPNFWFENMRFSEKIHEKCSLIITMLHFMLLATEIAAFITQKNLTEKQESDHLIFSFSQPIMYMEVIGLYYYKDDIKEVLNIFTVKTKKHYNNLQIEKEMIKKAKLCSLTHATFISMALIFYGFDGLQQAFTKDGTFTTVILAWPTVEDKSALAGIVRVIFYVIWWTFMIRVETGYTITICLMNCLSHQYKHVRSYFYSLTDIFEREELSQEEKEREYEKRLKIGIMLHSDTLRCHIKCEKITNSIFGGHIVLNVSVIALLMVQTLNSERTMVNVLPGIASGSCLLLTTALVMLAAGDASEEASLLPNAMFHSGWHCCTGRNLRRVQRILVIAITHSQRPVTLKCLGIITISYSSFLKITKTSYSIFSVLY